MVSVASLERFELSTHCLEGSCSVHLSYRDSLGVEKVYPRDVRGSTLMAGGERGELRLPGYTYQVSDVPLVIPASYPADVEVVYIG